MKRDVRQWWYYPIEVPLTKDGEGPAIVGLNAASISYEVWDQFCNTHSVHNNLPDAINEAMRMNYETNNGEVEHGGRF